MEGHSRQEERSMLTERLKAAMESAAELPPEAQDKLAEEIQNAI
jgi:hypothetical protein